MGNEVDIDEAALAAEAAAVDVGDAAAAPGPEGAPAAAGELVDVAAAEQFAQRAQPMVAKLLAGITAVAVPNWTITEAQNDELSRSVSFALALWFPHEIPPKYAALLMVGVSCYGIVQANRDPQTGQLKPRVDPRTNGATAEA